MNLDNADGLEKGPDIDEAKKCFMGLMAKDESGDYPNGLSEADTRVKLIDEILKHILGWPEKLIKREPHIESGYIDYLLSTTHPYYVVEAKKRKIRFTLPSQSNRFSYKIGGVLSGDKNLLGAIRQARQYAVDHGVQFCCVTNGDQFVFFRASNQYGLEWSDHDAIVFRSHQEIIDRFIQFYELLSYDSVRHGTIHESLPVRKRQRDALRQFILLDPKKQALYRTRERNKLFLPIKDIISHVFQDIYGQTDDTSLLKNCYVESPRDSSYERGLDGLIKQKPVDWGLGSHSIDVGKKHAGIFQDQVHQDIERNNQPEVLLLLGGVGVGKTTFIHRFRNVISKDEIDRSALWGYIDFNKFSDTGEVLLDWTAKELLDRLENDYPEIDIQGYSTLKAAYHREYEKLKTGRLRPIFDASKERFEEEFAKELAEYEKDSANHAIRLISTAAEQTGRRIFLVFDNADQFDVSLQDKVFRMAQKWAKETGGASVISLREESYWKNKDFGALSAFHAISFHVQAPRLRQVISKRFKYARKLVENGHMEQFTLVDDTSVTKWELSEVLDVIAQGLLGPDKRYIEFLEWLSPFEVRRPLDFLAKFLYSGHTNLDATLRNLRKKGEYVAPAFHEFVTAITLGDQEVYSEDKSDILNLFSVDGSEDASNLNRFIVFGEILKDKDKNSEYGRGFVSFEEIMDRCRLYGMEPDTVQKVIAVGNAKRLLETESQIKKSLADSAYVRATPASVYYLDKLVYEFAYIDMMLSDTALRECARQKRISSLTDEISDLKSKANPTRLKRLQKRLERGKEFMYYVKDEFDNSTAAREKESISPIVLQFMEKAIGIYIRRQHAIESRAKELFG